MKHHLYFVQELDKNKKLYPSEKTKVFFADLIESRLSEYRYDQLLKLPVMVNKLDLDDIELETKLDGSETNLTTKIIKEL